MIAYSARPNGVTSGRVALGELSVHSPDYPLKRLEVLKVPEGMTGLAANAPVQVKHCIAIRLEFPGVNCTRGPIKDFVIKIFPKGSSTFPGIILGMPALDVPPLRFTAL